MTKESLLELCEGLYCKVTIRDPLVDGGWRTIFGNLESNGSEYHVYDFTFQRDHVKAVIIKFKAKVQVEIIVHEH